MAADKGEIPTGVRVAGVGSRWKAKAAVVPFGHVSGAVCEVVYKSALAMWGLDVGGTTQESRDEFLNIMAEVLINGTSAEIDWSLVEFTYDGAKRNMSPLATAAAQSIPLANPVRVWTRDFRKGELPFRMYEMLNNPENLEMRQHMASSYETTVNNAQYCFDTSDALITSGLMLSHSDILMIKKLSSFTIGRAQQNGIANGDMGASSNHQGTVGGSKQPNAPSTAAAASVAPPEQRAGFKSLRG